jgi:hypothetical protein
MSKKNKNSGGNIKSALNEAGGVILGETKKSLNNSLNDAINQAGNVVLNAGVNALRSGNLKSAGNQIKDYAVNAAADAIGDAAVTALNATIDNYGHKITKFLGADFKISVNEPIGFDVKGVTSIPAVIEYGIMVISSILFIIFSSLFWLKVVVAVILVGTIAALIRTVMIAKTERILYDKAIAAFNAHRQEFSNHDICYHLDKGRSVGSNIDRAYAEIKEYHNFCNEKVDSETNRLITTILFSLFWVCIIILIIVSAYNKLRQWFGW